MHHGSHQVNRKTDSTYRVCSGCKPHRAGSRRSWIWGPGLATNNVFKITQKGQKLSGITPPPWQTNFFAWARRFRMCTCNECTVNSNCTMLLSSRMTKAVFPFGAPKRHKENLECKVVGTRPQTNLSSFLSKSATHHGTVPRRWERPCVCGWSLCDLGTCLPFTSGLHVNWFKDFLLTKKNKPERNLAQSIHQSCINLFACQLKKLPLRKIGFVGLFALRRTMFSWGIFVFICHSASGQKNKCIQWAATWPIFPQTVGKRLDTAWSQITCFYVSISCRMAARLREPCWAESCCDSCLAESCNPCGQDRLAFLKELRSSRTDLWCLSSGETMNANKSYLLINQLLRS